MAIKRSNNILFLRKRILATYRLIASILLIISLSLFVKDISNAGNQTKETDMLEIKVTRRNIEKYVTATGEIIYTNLYAVKTPLNGILPGDSSEFQNSSSFMHEVCNKSDTSNMMRILIFIIC